MRLMVSLFFLKMNDMTTESIRRIYWLATYLICRQFLVNYIFLVKLEDIEIIVVVPLLYSDEKHLNFEPASVSGDRVTQAVLSLIHI